jgi:putative SOS response-associated peptidase YedK
MCGRYVLSVSARRLAGHFHINLDEELERMLRLTPRYNIAPSQLAPIFRLTPEGGRPELANLKWGLLPGWAKDPKIAYHTINAMAETVDTKPAFRAAFKKRRCIVPMSGFYEWKRLDEKNKQPNYIHGKDEDVLGIAGLWEHWEHEGEVVESFTVITTDANKMMKSLHHRMPVILKPDDYRHWVEDGAADPGALKALLKPCPASWLTAYPVSKLVNNPKNQSPECIAPAT